MTENMQKFLEAVSKNEELTAKVGAMGKDELIALARELGIELIDADLEKPAMQELSADDLDPVAGGGDVSCAMGGGGTKDSNDKTCACVLAGAGYSKTAPSTACEASRATATTPDHSVQAPNAGVRG